jgi:lia operon protein LiaF
MLQLRRSRPDGRILFGLIIIILGLILLLENIYPNAHIWRFIGRLWPLILILLGLYIVFSRHRMQSRIYISSRAAYNRILGDMRLDYQGKELGNFVASQIVGDLTVDLTGSRLKPGINNITISTIIGDSSIIIPRQFPLKISAKTILGDIDFERRREGGIFPKMEHSDDNYETFQDKLFITISGVIGDMRLQRG